MYNAHKIPNLNAVYVWAEWDSSYTRSMGRMIHVQLGLKTIISTIPHETEAF
jgi:hypothetical protein